MGTLIKLEKKEDVIRRHGHSPDHFDADILAMRQTTTASIARTAGTPHTGRRRWGEAGRTEPKHSDVWKPLRW